MGFIQRQFITIFFGLALFSANSACGQNQILVIQPGNQNTVQPKIPNGSQSRTRSSNGSFEGKYIKIRNLIAKDKKMRRQIKKSAARFGIDPIHIVGALVGEHTYNVDALDYFQTYFVKAASYLKSAIVFQYDGEHVLDFVKRPQFTKCNTVSGSYELWDCREEIWNTQFAGKSVGGKTYPKDRFSKVFFQPLYAGQTFGLGQLNPLTALRATDYVSKITGKRKLSANNAPKVYETIMKPNSTFDYMAAIIRLSIDSYKKIARVDISQNPGITATLYNLGDVIDRATVLANKRKTDPSILPTENYYGWLVNEKSDELRKIIQ